MRKLALVFIFLLVSALTMFIVPAQASVTIDSYQPSPDFMFGTGNGTTSASFAGETFVISESRQISSVQFLMNKTNTWTGAIVVQIWNLQGTPGVNALPQGILAPSGAFPQGALLTSNPITDSSMMPTNATAIPVTFTFPLSNSLTSGHYYLTFTENSTQAVGAIPLTGHGLVADGHIIVQIGMKFGGLANYNAFRDSGIIINAGRNFWFVVTGPDKPSGIASSVVGVIFIILLAIIVKIAVKDPDNASKILAVGISLAFVLGIIFLVLLAVGL